MLKLSFDGCLVYDRPYLNYSLVAEFIKYILGKSNSPAVHVEAKKRCLRRAVEAIRLAI